jgi:CMP-N,N'-diacetyllegionaminic acid synthase
MQKILGIIPARGGSKGIPQKNKKLLGNLPLVAYTFKSAIESRLLSDCILSTDDEDIAKIAMQYGIKVPFMRPAHLATDEAKSIDVVIHSLIELQKIGKQYDAVCLLQPTNPLRSSIFIDKAIETYINGNYDSLISVLPVPDEYNPHWIFTPNDTGHLKLATGEKEIIPRRQDLPRAYFRDGSIYITSTKVLLQQKSFYGEKLGYILADAEKHVNIDTPHDWELAEKKLTEHVRH